MLSFDFLLSFYFELFLVVRENDVSESPPNSEVEVLFNVFSPFEELKLESGMNSGDYMFKLLFKSLLYGVDC